MSTIDLHIHSSYSGDGEYTPRDIIAQCAAQGITLAAIADHNSVRAVPEALDAAAREGIRLLAAVELDCTCGGRNFHLLGYGFDYKNPEYDAIEQDVLRQEQQAGEEKIRLFRNATGIPISIPDIMAAADHGVVTGELIAEILLASEYASEYEILRPYLPGGAKSDMPYVRFYWDFFSKGKPAYVPIHYMELADAVKLIHQTGGLAVLAHPGQTLGDDTPLLPDIISQGIDGLEAFSSYHDSETAAFYLEAARQNHLMVTCGSDFHGKTKPQIALGGHHAALRDEEILEGLASHGLI